ncbi:MAG: helix-turn-helix domain-containing protein, partial [Anaerolineae bacterium]|nr:helix-turn-helix domain-containing protein [Anaerolineae bacterium]
MLMRLLRLIAESDGSLALPELARRLRVSETMLDGMIEDLVRMGYLAPATASERGRGCDPAGAACRLCWQGR